MFNILYYVIMFPCYCSSGTWKEIKALNGSQGVWIKHLEHFSLGKGSEALGHIFGGGEDLVWPQLSHQLVVPIWPSPQNPFSPIFPMGKGNSRSVSLWEGLMIKQLWKLIDLIVLMELFLYFAGKKKKINGKIWTGQILLLLGQLGSLR